MTSTVTPFAPAAPGRLLFERFMGRYEHGAVEPLLELFTPDAEIVTLDGTHRGHPAIAIWLAEHLDTRGPGLLVSTDGFAEHGDVVRYEATIASPDGDVRQVYGVLVLDDGRIARYVPGLLADLNGTAT